MNRRVEVRNYMILRSIRAYTLVSGIPWIGLKNIICIKSTILFCV